MKTLKGTSFILREWKNGDEESLTRHANNRKIAQNLRDVFPHPYTLQDAYCWIKMISGINKDIVYAIVVDDQAVGGIGLHTGHDIYRYNAELGYWLSEDYWGKGITTEAVKLILEAAFKDYPWTRIYASVFHTNKASMRVLEKCGFRREAILRKSIKKQGEYLDEYIFALLKQNYKP